MDLDCLHPGVYLNDRVIDFYLMYVRMWYVPYNEGGGKYFMYVYIRVLVVNELNSGGFNCKKKQPFVWTRFYSGTSDKGPSEIGTASLQRTLVAAPC